MKLPVLDPGGLDVYPHFELILDGLVGYSWKGEPRGRVAGLINRANQSGIPILALETPSGLGIATIKTLSPTICPTATISLALPEVS